MKNTYLYILIICLIFSQCFCITSIVKNNKKINELNANLININNTYTIFKDYFNNYKVENQEYNEYLNKDINYKIDDLKDNIKNQIELAIISYFREKPVIKLYEN